jgi:hypothetical protein
VEVLSDKEDESDGNMKMKKTRNMMMRRKKIKNMMMMMMMRMRRMKRRRRRRRTTNVMKRRKRVNIERRKMDMMMNILVIMNKKQITLMYGMNNVGLVPGTFQEYPNVTLNNTPVLFMGGYYLRGVLYAALYGSQNSKMLRLNYDRIAS